MATANSSTRASPIHPVHAVLLASSLPLFVGTLLSDWAYSVTYEVQWRLDRTLGGAAFERGF